MAAKKTSRKRTAAKSGSRKAPVKKTTKKKVKKRVKKKAVARTGKPKKKVPAPKKRTSTKPAARSKKKTTKVATKKAVVRRKTEKKVARGPVLDLRGLRKQLVKKQAELLQAYNSAKGESLDRRSDGTEDYIDYAVSSYDREFLLSLTELEQNQLMLVDDAIKRIDRKDFGRCSHCDKPIPGKRLEVQPWARYCVRCQELADQGLTDDSFDDGDDSDVEPDVDDDVDEDDREEELGTGAAHGASRRIHH